MDKITVPDIGKLAEELLNDLEENGFGEINLLGISREGEWSKDYARFPLPYPDAANQRFFDEEEFLNELADHTVEYFYSDDKDVDVAFDEDVVEVRRVAPPLVDDGWL